MLRNVFTKSLWDQRRALVGWSIGIALLVLLEAALWPSIRDMPGFAEFLSNYPEAMRELFNLEEFTTGRGFLNAELYSIVLPIVFLMFGIGRGARAIAGEEEAGTLEVLLVTPVSATRLVLQHAAALIAATATLGAVLFAAVMVTNPIFDLGIGMAQAATGSLSMVLLGTEFGCLALATGAMTGHKALAIGVSASAAVASYLLYAFGQLLDQVRPWQPLSPFHQALEGGPLGAGLPLAYGWMILAAGVVIAIALPVFDRRNISVH